MSKLYLWEKVIVAVVVIASLVAGYQGGGTLDALMAVVINTLIV